MTFIAEALKDPDPFATAEQLHRFHHDDVVELTLEEFDDERWRMRTAKAFGLITTWGRERLGVLDRASERRRKATSR